VFITLSWVVLLCAILVLFIGNWLDFAKKITAPFAVRLFIPLILASWLVIANEFWMDWGLLWTHWACVQALKWLSQHVYDFIGQAVVLKTWFITLIALIPTFLVKLVEKPFRPFRPPYWASIYIWLIMAIMVVLPYE
jgi:hypothetical protein